MRFRPSTQCLPQLHHSVSLPVCLIAVLSNSSRPHLTRQAPLFMGFSKQEYWSGLPCAPPGDLPNPGIEPRSPALQADSLPAEPQGKPKNTWESSLSLLQQIFQTQESKWGLLHGRRILYQLSYQGSHSRAKLMLN